MGYYLKKFWALNFAAIFFCILNSVLMVVHVLMMMQMGQGLFDLDVRRFLFWMLVDTALWLVMMLANLGETYWKGRAIRAMNNEVRRDIGAMNNEVRRDIGATLLRTGYQEYHAQDTGGYLSWLTNDVKQMETLAWTPFFGVFSQLASIAGSVVALTSMHWSLLAGSVTVGVVMLVLPKLFSKKMEALGERCAREQGKGTSWLKDLLAGFDVLRFFGRAARFRTQMDQASDQIEKPQLRLTVSKAKITAGLEVVNLLCQTGLNILIGVLSIRGIILQAAMFGGGNLCGSISSGVGQLSQLRLALAASKPYFGKIRVHAGQETPGEEGALPTLDTGISIEHLGFLYDGQHPVLQDFSYQFELGKKYAIIGPSGCGKSTLLKLLLGWLPNYQGTIRIGGRDIREFTDQQLQSQMSYIEQNVFLFNSSILDNITLGEAFSQEDLDHAVQNSALINDLPQFPDGLNTIVGENGSNLSGGQKQRVALARALIHHRSILLVDEGTSALDQKNADIVEQSLLSNPDITLILVSHHLSLERKQQFDSVIELLPHRT